VTGTESLAHRFEQDRAHLRQVAYRMLGSLSDADDAVQEAWLRLDRTDTSEVGNLTGWLTTVVSRVCLDMLRSRGSRDARNKKSEDNKAVLATAAATPEQETQLANAVGLALLVVLERLDPAERLAFVLHDMFAVPFDEIAEIVGRTSEATRQLASRARRRVQGAPVADSSALVQQRATIAAFLTAMRSGDFDGLVAVLHPDLHVQVGGKDIHGAATWAKGAVQFQQGAQHMQIALIDGQIGVIFAPAGTLERAMRMTFDETGRVATITAVIGAEKIGALEIAVVDL
jgi:RNA polymerase sigma factor (sigma-70 family)